MFKDEAPIQSIFAEPGYRFQSLRPLQFFNCSSIFLGSLVTRTKQEYLQFETNYSHFQFELMDMAGVRLEDAKYIAGKKLENEKYIASFNHNSENFRSLNQLMWQIPMIAMTLTGGLWFGVSKVGDSVAFQACLLLLAMFGNIGLIVGLRRLRFIMGKYLDWFELNYRAGYIRRSTLPGWKRPTSSPSGVSRSRLF